MTIFSIKNFGLAIGSTALLLTGGILGAGQFQTHGMANPLQLVDKYLLALEKKDAESLEQLSPRNSTVDAAIQEKMSRMSGLNIENRQVFRTHTTPAELKLKVYGSYLNQQKQRQPFEDTLTLVYQQSNLLPISSKSWQLVTNKKQRTTNRR
jgi:hypothetical protein